MAAPVRSLLCLVNQAATRTCCRRIHFNNRSRVMPVFVTPPLSIQAKPCCDQLQRPVLYSLARSLLICTNALQTRSFSQFSNSINRRAGIYNTGLLQRLTSVAGVLFPQPQPSRTVIRFSRNKGKKKSVKAVTDRFYRFSNGLWLRTIAGRNKKRWKKSPARKRRTKFHVFCSKTQSKKLDLMVSSYWKERRYYPDDPLEPFQERNFKGLNFYPGEKAVHWRKDV